ncbi:hypothetical protein, partial [Clostridioides difficile]|uniref:hypothetical protein n=1 Tax=Clostridioides difficile TaxID=1496 RepID=UPI0018DB856B
VGITQFLLWVVLIITLSSIAQSFIPHETLEQVKAMQQNGGVMPTGVGVMQASEGAQKIYDLQHSFSTVNWSLVIGCFI